MGGRAMIYTKEPWEIDNGGTGAYIIAKDGNGNHVTVAQVFPQGVVDCETEGNASLIKAAPKMYEVLKEIEDITHDPIAKAAAGKILAEVEGKEDEDVLSV